MNITFLTPHIYISGGVKMILSYSDRLAKRGHEVNVICPQPTFAKKSVKGIPIVYPKRFQLNFFNYKPDWVEVSADIKYVPSYEERYIPDGDIVVATASYTAPYVINYQSKKGRKFYFIQSYESLYYGDKNKVDETYQYPIKKIVVSNWIKEILKDKFNVDSEVIVNPIDFGIFYPTRNAYNKNKRICMLHHNYTWKGVNEGVKAFKKVKKKRPEIELVMFGTRRKEIEFNYEYHYRAFDDKLRKIYNSCDIFLCPSWKEGLGMSSMEAMACKCGLVTTDTGGNWDYAIHKKTALVSPPKNPKALAENLTRLLDDEDLLKKIAQNGYEHIKQFTWDKAIDRIESIFLSEIRREKRK